MRREVLITGGTGCIGRRLAAALLARGHRVRLLTRAFSAGRVPPGAEPVVGNALDASSFAAAVLRPWYMLGPGHRRPLVLLPLYALLEALPATRAGARRLGLVTLAQMVDALVHAVETPPPPASSIGIVEVPDIRPAPRAAPLLEEAVRV